MYNTTTLFTMVLFLCAIAPVRGQEMSFSADSVITTGSQPMSIVCADFNNDNALDLAVAITDQSRSHPIAIFLNDGEGKLSTIPDSMYQNANASKGIAVGDINNDQVTDLAVSIYDDSTVTFWLGNGDGTFTKGSDVAVPTKPGALLIADLDNDMNNDLAVVSRFSLLMIYKGNSQGGFSEPVTTAGISTAEGLEVFDMNGDNYLDLLVGSGNVRSVGLYLNDGEGNFATRTSISTQRTPWFNKVGDFNKDSYPDIATGSGSWDFDNVSLLLGDAEGNYTCSDTASAVSYVRDISAGDYNQDKNLDVLVADKHGLYILSGNGDGHFTRIDTIDADENAYMAIGLQSADINGDDRIDLIVAREEKISVYYNTGQFTFISGSTIMPGEFRLSQNYPNPFNPLTRINYELPMTNAVELNIYNLLGQKVAALVSETQGAGQYQVQWDASGFSSGVYFYILKTESGSLIKKMQIIK